MPAMLEDPTASAIYRTSGAPPYPTPADRSIPASIVTRHVTLRDRITMASLIPFSTPTAVPLRLLTYLCNQLNLEIEKGDTYPMVHSMPVATFGTYWFQNFGAIMLLGEVASIEEVARLDREGAKWEERCLGSFYIKPNYPGRSSHVCNAGFIVTEAARNRGVGRLMGEGYLEWAPKLGYSYSVFNLVYETNVASCRIWDALGFKRIGRVKGCGNLRSHPDELVDAIIYGRDLGPDGEDYVSEERFDKIRFYLRHARYPNGADRAEKSRLRSAATHYKLLPAEDGDTREENERLMLKDKEVVSDPQRQYEIARQIHSSQHGGINKTTATIAEKYHWVRIKETVSLVIKNCPDCKDSSILKATPTRSSATTTMEYASQSQPANKLDTVVPATAPVSMSAALAQLNYFPPPVPETTLRSTRSGHRAPMAPMRALDPYTSMPLDPQIIQSAQAGNHGGNDYADGLQQVAAFTDLRHPDHHFDPDLGMTDDGMHVHADTRLASERHVRDGDDPMTYQDAQGVLHHTS